MIQIRGLRKELNGKWVLDGVDLDIHEGMTLVIMGPSGTGKGSSIGASKISPPAACPTGW